MTKPARIMFDFNVLNDVASPEELAALLGLYFRPLERASYYWEFKVKAINTERWEVTAILHDPDPGANVLDAVNEVYLAVYDICYRFNTGEHNYAAGIFVSSVQVHVKRVVRDSLDLPTEHN